MAGIEEATKAFETNISGAKPSEAKAKPTERMFKHLESPETDEEAGGDNIPTEEELAASKEEEEEEQPPKKEPPEEGEEEDETEEGEEKSEEDEEEKDEDVYEVLVDGEKKEVSLREALDGYIRTETFQGRLSQVMAAKTEVEKQAREVYEMRQTLAKKLDDMDKQMELMVPQEPDWDEMFKTDPGKARQLQKQYDEFYRQRDEIRAKRDKELADAQEDHDKRLNEYVNTEARKFVASEKKWSDKKVFERDMNAMRTTAANEGFSEEEIASVYDSRMLRILLKASKYDRLMAQKPQPVKRGRSVKPGAGDGVSGTARRGLEQAQKRLSKTGSVEDAASVFKTILSRR